MKFRRIVNIVMAATLLATMGVCTFPISNEILAIVVGVAFVIATFVMGATCSKRYKENI